MLVLEILSFLFLGANIVYRSAGLEGDFLFWPLIFMNFVTLDIME